jgi:hypothetical protein
MMLLLLLLFGTTMSVRCRGDTECHYGSRRDGQDCQGTLLASSSTAAGRHGYLFVAVAVAAIF